MTKHYHFQTRPRELSSGMESNPMKTLSLIILTAALGAGCGKQENAEAEKPQKLIVNPIIEKAIKDQLVQPPDELTEGDLA